MENDARILMTKRMITEALFSMLQEKDLNKITVKELCAAAHVNRGTFYKHYQDIYDLVEHLERETIGVLTANINSGMSMLEITTTVLRKFKENPNIYRPFMGPENKQKFISDIWRLCIGFFAKLQPLSCEEHGQFKIYYIIGGGSEVVNQWIENGLKEEPELIAAEIKRITDCIILTHDITCS